MKVKERTAHVHAPRFDLDRFLPYRLARLSAALSAEFARVYGARHGISAPEWRVLAHLSQEDGLSVREIHARAGMDKPKISRAAARLVAAGLASKKAGADRRLVSLTLTEAGRTLIEDLVPHAREFERRALSPLSEDEARAFSALIDKLIAAGASPRP